MTDGIINGKWSADGPCRKGAHMAPSTYTTDPNDRFGGKGLRLLCKNNFKIIFSLSCADFTIQKLRTK